MGDALAAGGAAVLGRGREKVNDEDCILNLFLPTASKVHKSGLEESGEDEEGGGKGPPGQRRSLRSQVHRRI